jgi:hypothetical protein
MQLTFRPLPTWPHKPTAPRSYSRFKANQRDTLRLLEYELIQLYAKNVIIGAGFRDSDLKMDGTPRADRQQQPYLHPGVEISFDSKFGRLTYATDEFTDWRANLRAIALSLQALRAVDRYGVSKRGQQYAGWAQLPPGDSLIERGRKLVEAAGSYDAAIKAHHPDRGGTTEDAAAINAYRDSQRQQAVVL